MPGILAGGEKALGGACKIVFFRHFYFTSFPVILSSGVM